MNEMTERDIYALLGRLTTPEKELLLELLSDQEHRYERLLVLRQRLLEPASREERETK